MPKFKFELPAPQDSATSYKKIKAFLSGENDFKKFDPEVTCTFDESSHSCNLKGKQFDAVLQVSAKEPEKTSIVSVEVEVSFALSLLKDKIKETIEKTLKRVL